MKRLTDKVNMLTSVGLPPAVEIFELLFQEISESTEATKVRQKHGGGEKLPEPEKG